MSPIYLDHNSTTPIDPLVVEAINKAFQAGYLNPASQHREGQRARREIESLRRKIMDMLGGKSHSMQADQLIITSGGTESNNLALIGLAHHAAAKNAANVKSRILVSAIEHPSVIGAAEALQRQGFEVEQIKVDENGVVCLNDLRQRLENELALPVALVSIMLANNETGVIQPVAAAAEICHQHSALLHTDAVQMVGKLPVNFTDIGCDAMSFTAHKLHGPRGIGGLLLKHGLTVEPILFGGFQQMAMRPGTEDVALLAGMHRAIELAVEDPERGTRMNRLREQLESALLQNFDVTINGQHAPRLPHTTNVSFTGIDRQAFLMAADIEGLAISTGSACASGSSEPSPVLTAMQANNDVVLGSIRISLGATTTETEIEAATAKISSIVDNLSKLRS
ncbi:cysteine desulfurase family protein [Mariniblastus fucicola]|uniref:cysteine desulfurase n=1 Tax=Mariniblastus fucicola TaxID=980251 RepID=A0A5B9PKP7_9BACT|nr:cysteine desulfurase family protein [Mariniblastus fucicola]QEG25276.1 Cysteine desulfurase [Mariniblastus fucicola]